MKGWTTVRCGNCGGHGVVSVYTLGGTDFDGPGECRECGGDGALWLHRTSGRIAQYPGGPFAGRLTTAEMCDRRPTRARRTRAVAT